MNQAYLKLAELVKKHRGDKVWLIRNIIELDPHEGQLEWVLGAQRRENMLVTGNRWGKSEITAAIHVADCLTLDGWDKDMFEHFKARNEPYTSMNIAPTAEQAAIVTKKMRQMLAKPQLRPLVKGYRDSPFPTIEFINGAVYQSRSTDRDGRNLEGGTWDRISYDEAALERHFIDIRDLLQMRILDHGGRINYVSTPYGRNEFGLMFLKARDGVARGDTKCAYAQAGPTSQNPYNSQEDLAELAQGYSERALRQRIYGEVVDPEGLFFSIAGIEAAVSRDLTRQNKILKEERGEVAHCEVYRGRDKEQGIDGVPWISAFPEHRFVHFWDLARKQDWTVGITLDISGEKMQQVEFERFQGMDWDDVFSRIRYRHNKYKVSGINDGPGSSSATYIDSTGIGDVAMSALKDIGAGGLTFTKQTKDEALANLQAAFDMHELEFPEIIVEFDELKFYERDDDGLRQDCVIALAGAVKFGRRHPVMEAWYF